MTLHAYEIPLTPEAQKFAISLGGVTYRFRFYWNPPNECWLFDIADANGVELVNAVPVVTGADLLGQYEYLGIAGALIVQTDYVPDDVPTYANLGQAGRVYFVAEA